jgi:hypothetical protein
MPERKRLQDQQVKGALQKFQLVIYFSSRHST